MGALPLALMAGQAALSTYEQNSAAAAQNRLYKQNAVAAGQAATLKGVELSKTFERETRAVSSEMRNAALGTLETVASMGVEAAASGVKGASSARVANSALAEGLREESSLREQLDELRFNTLLSAKGITAETQNRINAVQRASGTSFLKQLAVQGLSYGASQVLNPSGAGKTKVSKIQIPTT